jgi:hypothetical protein
MLVGLIDGDGYICIIKTSKGFIKINLTISLHINDLSTLEYILSVLGLGKITVYFFFLFLSAAKQPKRASAAGLHFFLLLIKKK